MTNQTRNHLATVLPINLVTTYFVANGIVYIYKTFLPNDPQYQSMLRQCDLAVLSTGEIVKNRGNVAVVELSYEIQNLLNLGSVAAYDEQVSPVLYFLEVKDGELDMILDSLATTRAIAQSTRTLYK